jgi:hypothetical protein
MLPDSPMASFLRAAPVVAGIEMAVIAGDIEGGNLLKRVGVLLTDFLLFDNVDNDLVVDTAAMLGGIAPQTGSRALFDRGAEVSHFRYFTNADTRAAVRDWLVAPEVAPLKAFSALPGRFEDMDALAEAAQMRSIGSQRGVVPADLPVVVVLPGVMGSHLWIKGDDRVWFDPADIALGGLDKIAWGQGGVEAEKITQVFYARGVFEEDDRKAVGLINSQPDPLGDMLVDFTALQYSLKFLSESAQGSFGCGCIACL